MKSVLGILALAALLPVLAGGQSATIAPGARVRVTSPSDDLKRHVTIVTEVRGDSIIVSGLSGSRTIALGNVTALDVSTGTRTHVVRYGLIGLGAGAVLGAVAIKQVKDDCDDELGFCPVPLDDGQFAAAGALVVGTVGLVTGVIAGAFHRTDRWERHSSIRASIAPSGSGGVTLRVSKAF